MRSKLDSLLEDPRGAGSDLNDPGFITSVKRGLGGMVAGVGEYIGDATGNYDNAVRQYGERVMERNPSGVNSTEELASNPWLGVKEAAGSSVAPLGAMLATRGVGRLAEASGAARTAAVLRSPITNAEVSGLQSYGDIGQAQRETDNENWFAKQGGALAVGAIENLGGVQRSLGLGGGRGLTQAAAREYMQQVAASPVKTLGKSWLKQGAQESLEEIAQNPIERGAGGRDAFDEEGVQQTQFGGLMGAIGGLALGPLGVAVEHHGAKQFVHNLDQAYSVLRDSQMPYEERARAGDFLTRVMSNDQGDAEAQAWWGSFQDALVQDRDAQSVLDALEQRRSAFMDEMQQIKLRSQLSQPGQSTDLLNVINESAGVSQMKDRLPMVYGRDVPEALGKQPTDKLTPAGQDYTHWWQSQEDPYAQWWRSQDLNRYDRGQLGRYPDSADGARLTPGQPGQTLDLFSGEWTGGAQPNQMAPDQQGGPVRNRRQTEFDFNQPNQVFYGSAQSPAQFSQLPITDNIRAASEQAVGPEVQARRAFLANGGSMQAWRAFVRRLGNDVSPDLISQGSLALAADAGRTKTPAAAWQAAAAAVQPQGAQNGQGQQTADGTNPNGYPNPQLRDQSQEFAQSDRNQVPVAAGSGYGQAVARQEEVTQPTEKEALGTRLAMATSKERGVILAVFGLDAEGNQSEAPMSYEAAGVKFGYPKKSARASVNAVLKKYGITKDVVDRFLAADAGAQQEVSAAELMPAQGEDGEVGGLNAAGFSVIDRPSDTRAAGVQLDGEDAAVARKQQRAADKAAAETGFDMTQLDAAPAQDNVETAAEQEILARREAAAAKERARTDDPENGAELDRRWVDHTGARIKQVDIDDATEDYNSDLMDGDAPFEALPEIDRLRYVKAYIAFQDSALSAQELSRIFGDIADGNRTQAPALAEGRSGQEEGPVGRLQEELPAGDARQADRRGSDQEGADEVSAQAIEDRWNQAARALGVARWEGLTDEQRNYILGSGTWNEFDDAAAEVLDEIQSVDAGQGAQFSEGASGGSTVDAVEAALRKAFLTPARAASIVRVYQTQDDAKAAGALSQNYNGSAKGWTNKGKVYLVADNIAPGQELAVILHEVGVHLGMERMIGEQNMDWLVDKVDQWAAKDDGSVESRVAKWAVERAGGSSSVDTREEKIAYMVEGLVAEGVTPKAASNTQAANWLRRLWNAMRGALQKLGVRSDRLGGQELVDLAYGAANLAIRVQTAANTAANPDTAVAEVERWAGPKIRRALDNSTVNYSEGPAYTPLMKLLDPARDQGVNFLDDLKVHGLGWLTLQQLADNTKNKFVQSYISVLNAMQRSSKDRVYEASLVDRDWGNLDEAVQKRLSDVMRAATRAQYDPDVDKPTDEAATALKAKFDALPDEAKSVYKRARDYYAENMRERREIIKELAEAAGQSEESSKLLRDMAQLKGPYFPLMRFGKFYSVGMSRELANLMAKDKQGTATTAEKNRIAILRRSPNHYVTRAFDSKAAAVRDAKALEKTLGVGSYNRVAERHGELAGVSIPEIGALTDKLLAGLPIKAGEKDEGIDREQVRTVLSQMYLDSLPESHALKRQMKREGVHGEDENMRRVFAASALSQAHYISRLKYARDVADKLRAVGEDARDDDGRRAVFNELMKRTNLAMDQETRSPFVDAMMSVSYFAHLGVSPAFWLTNMAQVPIVAAPWLAARYGVGSSTNALASAYRDAVSIIKATYKTKNWRAELDWTKTLRSDEGRMMQDLMDRNLLDITIEHDLTAVAEMTNSKMGDYLKMANLPVHVTELANRSVVALATYRLAKANAPRTLTEEQQHKMAVDAAAKAISETQLDYSGLNAPRHMQSVLGSRQLARMMFQFRKFQQGMLHLVGKSVYDAIKGSGLEKTVARRQLVGMAAMTWLFAGALGMPLAGNLLWVLEALIPEDDDEPLDLEVELRNFLHDVLGDVGENVVTKGLVGTILGVDLTKRVGMGDLASPLPFIRDGKNPTDSMNNALSAVAGAGWGTALTIGEGMADLAKGDFAKGVEKVVPIKLAQNLVRAGRYGADGLTNKNGDTILPSDKFSVWDLAMRGAGFQTTKEVDYYEGNNAMMTRKQATEDTRTALLRQYAHARIKGEDLADINAQITEFNQRHPQKGVKIDQSTKLKAVETRRKLASGRSGSGLRADKATKPYLDTARFAQ